MFKRGTTLVLGSGALADRVADALTSNGQSVRRMPDTTGRSQPIRTAQRLILAEPDELRAAALANRVAQVGAIGGQSRLHLGSDPNPDPSWMAAVAPPGAGWRYLCWPRIAARILLNRYPLHFAADVAAGQAPQLLILGYDAIAQALMIQVLRLGHYGTGRLSIDVLCRTPEQAATGFASEYPQAHQLHCTLRFHDIDGHWPLAGTPSAAFIALDDDQGTLSATRQLGEQLQARGQRHTPLFPMLAQPPRAGAVDEWDGRTYPFVPLFEVCAQAITTQDPRDALARIIHDHYQDTIASQARDPASAPAAVPWRALDESYRDASRNQSDHVQAKLALIRARAAEASGQGLFTFAANDVERLARVEHDRWAADRFLAGWRYAPQRDNKQKLHPDLVPFDHLSEPIKDLDRYAVRLLPALLGRRESSIQTNLLVLIWLEDSATLPAKATLTALMDRLSERYSDRYPTLLCRLANSTELRLATIATRNYGAALRVLFPSTAIRRAGHTRTRYLKLLAQAEGRYHIPGARPDLDWLREQVDIICTDNGGRALLPAGNTDAHPRVVELLPIRPHIHWHFEY